MAYKTKTIAATGGPPPKVVAAASELGWRPDDVYREHQITVVGLDGGTFSVKGLVPGEEKVATQLKTFASGKAEDAVVQLSGFAIVSFEVTFAGLGPGAAPVVTFTSFPRGI